MSSGKRRAKRQIDRLVRMDEARSRMLTSSLIRVMSGSDPATRFWETNMVPLGAKLWRKGLRDRAINALNHARERRVAAGGNA